MPSNYLTNEERAKIKELMNPPGHNFKDVNFIKLIRREGKRIVVEVGYWITFLNCRPKYQKETAAFDL